LIKEEKHANDQRNHEMFLEFTNNAKKSTENTEVDAEEICEEPRRISETRGKKCERLEIGSIEKAGQSVKVYTKKKPLIEVLDYEDMDVVDPDMPRLEPIHGVHNVKVE